MKSLKNRIILYRGANMLEGGYVVTFNGAVSGWTATLGNPGAWMPGCIAIDEAGGQWVAKGGSDYDGAERWEAIEQAKANCLNHQNHEA